MALYLMQGNLLLMYLSGKHHSFMGYFASDCKLVVQLWVLLGVPLEKLRGVVLGVLEETRFRRVMEVGHLELVVVVTHRALQFSGHMHRAAGLEVVELVAAHAVVVVLGGRARFAYSPWVGVGVVGPELGLVWVVGPKHVPRLSFTFLS